MPPINPDNARCERLRRKFVSKQNLQISTRPTSIRSLRRSARAAHRLANRHSKVIQPWVHEISYKYAPYPETTTDENGNNLVPVPRHLLNLPTEIRQQILLLSLHDLEDTDTTGYSTTTLWKRIGEISTVSPIIRMDMPWVASEATRLFLSPISSPAPAPVPAPIPPPTIAAGVTAWPPSKKARKRKKGQIALQTRKPKKSARRPQKCWYCEERHQSGDPVCAMERRDPEKWASETKVLGAKVVEKVECPGFKGTITVFDD